jgi:hypothetical protein
VTKPIITEEHANDKTEKNTNNNNQQQQQQKSYWEMGPVEKQRDRQTHRRRMDIAAASRASRLHHLCCVKGESLVTYAEEHKYSRVFFNDK